MLFYFSFTREYQTLSCLLREKELQNVSLLIKINLSKREWQIIIQNSIFYSTQLIILNISQLIIIHNLIRIINDKLEIFLLNAFIYRYVSCNGIYSRLQKEIKNQFRDYSQIRNRENDSETQILLRLVTSLCTFIIEQQMNNHVYGHMIMFKMNFALIKILSQIIRRNILLRNHNYSFFGSNLVEEKIRL